MKIADICVFTIGSFSFQKKDLVGDALDET